VIQKEDKVDDLKLLKKQKKFIGQGLCKSDAAGIYRCDFREVRDGKFVDDGSDLQEYLANCKKEKRDKARAAAQVLRKEQQQAERDERNKIESKKIAVGEQLQKIRRRKPPESQPTA